MSYAVAVLGSMEPPSGRPGPGIPAPEGDRSRPGTKDPVIVASASAFDLVQSWWSRQTDATKTLVGVGGLAALGLVLYSMTSERPKRATPNRATKKYAPVTKKQKRRSSAKKGKIMTLKSGRRYGHIKPPKRHWDRGARRPSDYADPEHYKYPLVFRNSDGSINQKRTRNHIRSASSYFARFKGQYPLKTRQTIAKNINKAKRRYGVGGAVIKP